NSMQGAQIWLMPGERMTLRNLLKAVIIGNANDAASVIAEGVSGNEKDFVALMNSRAAELGMENTLFLNPNGYYDDDKQYTTPSDAAKLISELAKHNELTEMFTTRLDELKNGEVSLVSMNTVAYRYKGAIGFKCGTGPESDYFAAEAARRDGCTFAAAVFVCDDEDSALSLSQELLDIAFGGYRVIIPSIPEDMPDSIAVKHGTSENVRLAVEDAGRIVVPAGKEESVTEKIILPEYVYAPCSKGEKTGELHYYLDDELLKVCRITAAEDVKKKDVLYILLEVIKSVVDF
ncbi:MAG: D-alanyl-D-alanine carboxypeptidase family protein, partial [Huintestinicola sp.]